MKRIATSALAAAMILAPSTRAAADADALVGGIVGGVVGGLIVNEANRNRAPAARTPRVSSTSSATRAANRETQTALNYFGFNAGPADGVIGRGTQAAIAGYQVHLGYPATGQLTPYERDFLITSYQRAIAGGAVTAQMIAADPMGAKGLLITFRDEQLGLQPAQPKAAGIATPAPDMVAADAPGPGLPNFLGGGAAMTASLASHCNEVSLLTSTNGGFVTLATMSDPMVALNEQFCLARTYVVAEGERLAAGVQGFTPQQIAAQCEGFGPAMRDQIAAVSLQTAPEVLREVSGFALGSGIAPTELAGTAKICLSVGYRTDNMDVAIASALLLTALGEPAYAELIGHHLTQGFGTTARPDLALGWFDLGFEAAGAGGRNVVAPGQPERIDLVRQAAYSVAGRAGADPGAVPVPAAADSPKLPSFKIAN